VNCEYIQYNYIDIIKNNNEVLNTRKLGKVLNYKVLVNKSAFIPSFSYILNTDNIYSEDIMGNLTYFILANIIIALLLLAINSYFSISVKYLDKGGGFECGFTSFVQTRERFNVIFYRVSLLFLVFDLEIILAFPYTVIYQKNQNISKNNVIAFLYILIVGFIYELKEGALNIVKKAHSTEINI
jgi:NADH-ubiquinone oxidoreductase chain 3